MNSVKNLRVALAAVCLIAGIGWLVLSATSVEGIVYRNSAEIRRSTDASTKFRLTGHVMSESIDRRPSERFVEFTVIDSDSALMRARYIGVIPDTFKDGAEVVISGTYDRRGELFIAQELLAKCPSKYQGGYDSSVNESASQAR